MTVFYIATVFQCKAFLLGVTVIMSANEEQSSRQHGDLNDKLLQRIRSTQAAEAQVSCLERLSCGHVHSACKLCMHGGMCILVCIYIHTYMYIYIHTHISKGFSRSKEAEFPQPRHEDLQKGESIHQELWPFQGHLAKDGQGLQEVRAHLHESKEREDDQILGSPSRTEK